MARKLERRKMKDRGVATVEASLVVSLFIFAVLAFVQMGFVMIVNKRIYTAFSESVMETAESAYGCQTMFSGDNSMAVYANVYSRLKKKLKSDLLVKEYVSGGTSGILLLSAKMTTDGFVEAQLRYDVRLNIPLLHSLKANFEEKQKQKAYVGYRELSPAEAYVYITDYQSVYHSNRACSHLSLKIREASKEAVMREESKLTDCSFCRGIGNRYYITEQGDCYHTSLACPGLTRTIYRVKKSSVEHLLPCVRCNSK